MPEHRIKELEGLLLVANNSLALLSVSNAELRRDLVHSQRANMKLKRTARRDERDFNSKLSAAKSGLV